MLGTNGREYKIVHKMESTHKSYTIFNQYLAECDDELFIVEVENEKVTWDYEINLSLNKPDRAFIRRDEETQAIVRQYAAKYQRTKKINNLFNNEAPTI